MRHPSPGALPQKVRASLFAQLYQDEVACLLQRARRLGRARSDSEDLAHETLLLIWTHMDDYVPGKASIRAWVMGFHVRVCMGAHSRASRRSRVHAGLIDPTELAEATDDRAQDPEVGASLREEAERAWALLDILPPEQRSVWVLQRLEGMSLTDIAEASGELKATVTSRLRLADKKLMASRGESTPAMVAPIVLGAGQLDPFLRRVVESLSQPEPLSEGIRDALLRRVESSLNTTLPTPLRLRLRGALPAVASHALAAALASALTVSVTRSGPARLPEPPRAEASARVTVVAPTLLPDASHLAEPAPAPATAVAPRAVTTERPVTAIESFGATHARLRAAQHALVTNPAVTLAAVRDQRARAPGVGLSGEWTFLEVQALLRLNRRAEAATVAERFRGSHPDDPIGLEMTRMVGQAGVLP